MTKLSVIVVTKNEAENIDACLKSVSFADEIIVFDSSSTDGTPDICRNYTHQVTITSDWPGDGQQKNRALACAQGDWVLCLDADERVSPELAAEIRTTMMQSSHAAFALRFQSTYCGKPIRFGDWRNESHVRLFRRTKAKFTDDIVHCHLQVEGSIGKLNHFVTHHPFHHLNAMLAKMNHYSSQSAKTLFNHGKKASLLTALSHRLWCFIRGYFLKGGFLDGREGFLLALSNAEGTYYRYLKLMYLSEQSNTDPTHD
ncbi:MAG: glycosyltransferase family 2 protein [Candidatus Berkiellales bacterium]